MGKRFKEVAEIVEINREEMVLNKELTEDLVAEDILLNLGYNRKRDRDVRKQNNGKLDYIIYVEGKMRIGMSVFGLGEEIVDSDKYQDILKEYAQSRLSVIIFTDGENIIVNKYNKNTSWYSIILSMSIHSETTEQENKILGYIEKGKLDVNALDGFIKVMPKEGEVEAIINSKVKEIAEIINQSLGNKYNITDIENIVLANISSVENKKANDIQTQDTDDNRINVMETELEQAIENANSKEAQLKERDTELIALKDEIGRLQNIVEELKGQVEASKEDKEIIDILKKRIESEEARNRELHSNMQTIIEEKDDEIQRLKTEGYGNSSTNENIDEVEKYREQIRELHSKISKIEDERDKAIEKMAEIQKEVESMQGAELKKAERLLDLIEDNTEDERTYVAVINEEITQYDEIHTFIGRCLQKLYELKGFEASQYIFNGDVYHIVTESKYNDLVMGNKTYDINLLSKSEDTELNKLRMVFSKFEDIAFVCKKIGKLTKPIDSRYNVEGHDEDEVGLEPIDIDERLGEPLDNDMVAIDDSDVSNDREIEENEDLEELEEDSIDFGDSLSEIGYDDETEEYNEDETEDYGEVSTTETYGDYDTEQEDGYNTRLEGFDDMDEGDEDIIDALVVHSLDSLDIDNITSNYGYTEYQNIKYICYGEHTIELRDVDLNNYNEVFSKSIEAILAAYSFVHPEGLVLRLRKADLSLNNQFIKTYSKNIVGEYSVIGGTRYIVQGLDRIEQVIYLIVETCKNIEISPEDILVYLECSTNNPVVLENYVVDEMGVKDSTCGETDLFVSNEYDETGIAIIKGDLLNNIAITKSSLRVHDDIIVQCVAIKAEYIGIQIEDYNDVLETIKVMLETANASGKDVNFNSIGNLIGESYKLISDDESQVGNDYDSVEVDGKTIYVSRIDDWRVVHSIIKIHTTIFNNISIAMKVIVNTSAVEFYKKEFNTNETALALAVNSITNYVDSHTRK